MSGAWAKPGDDELKAAGPISWHEASKNFDAGKIYDAMNKV